MREATKPPSASLPAPPARWVSKSSIRLRPRIARFHGLGKRRLAACAPQTYGASIAVSLIRQCHLLNLVQVTGHFFAKNPRQIRIMPDDHVGVVFLVIIVLPAFVPPAKA